MISGKMLLPGDPAPDFSCKAAIWCSDDIEEIEIKLEDFLGNIWYWSFTPKTLPLFVQLKSLLMVTELLILTKSIVL